MGPPALLWFRRDLRVADNPALEYAASRGGPVIPVFVWAPEEEGKWAPGAASRWWLHHSLLSLDRSLRGAGLRLILRRGPSRDALLEIARETGARVVVWSRLHEPAARARDAKVEAALAREGIEVSTHNASLLAEPWEIETKEGSPYKVFTPFWRRILLRPEPGPAARRSGRLLAPGGWPRSLRPEELGLLPTVDWATGLREAWAPGEAGAARELGRFLDEAVRSYETLRNLPSENGTSRLSPHLHFGEIGPARIWFETRHMQETAARGKTALGFEAYLRQLAWREFAYHLLHHFPRTPDEPLNPAFARFPWRRGKAGLSAWKRGLTGYPFVDAGMRQLWRTGWMHNRVRMVVASFLTKDLLLPWREGARWFWNTLVDADLANNTLGWQWTAGCGADAAPYFRVFHPVAQGVRYDPEGAYVRSWVPDLRALSGPAAHEPWRAASRPRASGQGRRPYPRPIVDHREARERALAAYDEMRRSRGPKGRMIAT